MKYYLTVELVELSKFLFLFLLTFASKRGTLVLSSNLTCSLFNGVCNLYLCKKFVGTFDA